MDRFLRKTSGQQQSPQQGGEDGDMEKFYTNSEHELQIFEQLIGSTDVSNRMLVIHGIGGVGKSTLLAMYRLSCHKHRIPVALVDSEESFSPVDILAGWTEALNNDGETLSNFQKALHRFRTIQAKVEVEANKVGGSTAQVEGKLGKAVITSVIGMALSNIPVIGPIAGALGGESTGVFLDWLHRFLSKTEVELYADPVKYLDSAFLSDLSQITSRKRIVLMIDTFELLTILSDWMRDLARKLPKNTLLVIASRAVPQWERSWPGWMGKAEIVELKEMTPDNLRSLVHRYYTYMRSGDPDPKQVEAIVEFARGLPMVATTVVQLWVKYGEVDFQAVRPQVVADLADRLLEGVPQEMRRAFEAAAVLRYFNVDALSALLEGNNAERFYDELRRWPFIRSRREGLAVHDTLREMISEALRVRAPKRYQTLHERAAVYYEAQVKKVIGDELERERLEQLYHRVHVDERSGVQQFQALAEELSRYRMVTQLQVLLNDVNSYPLVQENSQMWRTYYNARLAYLGGKYLAAAETYQSIGENKRLEPKLRAYALCDLGEVLCLRDNLYQPDDVGTEEAMHTAIQVLEKSLNVGVEKDVKLAMNWLYLSDVYAAVSNWDRALKELEQPKEFYKNRGDETGYLLVLYYERVIYRRQGNWRKMFDVGREMYEIFSKIGEPPYLRILVSFTWEWVLAGYCAASEEDYRQAIRDARPFQDRKYLAKKNSDLALSLSFQGKCAEALIAAEEGLTIARSVSSGDNLDVFSALTLCGITFYKCAELERAETYLTEAITLGEKIHAFLVSTPLYLANVYELLENWDKAETFYQKLHSQSEKFVQYYFLCGGYTGQVRVKHAQNIYAAIPELWSEAEKLAKTYEYNDFLASLYLSRGHLAWDGLIPVWEDGFESAFSYYKLALIYALRYNRLLLDEVLSGGEHQTLLKSIIRHCLERKKEGQMMLGDLRKWWQNGANDTGMPRVDTISPISEDISLLEAERIAREREPGDGSQQITLVEHITAVLTRVQGVYLENT